MTFFEDWKKESKKEWKKEKRKKEYCCHLLQTATITTSHNRNTKQTPKPPQKMLNHVETPIPESLLRQSVPIKMWVAAEKLKEKNFREEQKGRNKIRTMDVQTSASPFQRKRCWGLPTETCTDLLTQVGFAQTCSWYHANEPHLSTTSFHCFSYPQWTKMAL